jgi:replicative DNA helicase
MVGQGQRRQWRADADDEWRRRPELDPALYVEAANLEAEQALLGALLTSNEALYRVVDLVGPEHFADGAHGRIFAAIKLLADRNQPANAVTLKVYFEKDDGLADVGGAAYLAKLQATSVAVINARDYAATIRDLWLRRQLLDTTREAIRDLASPALDSSAEELAGRLEGQLLTLVDGGGPEKARPATSEMQSTLARVEERFKAGGGLLGEPLGFRDLDELLGGLEPGTLTLVAGRPGMGKTSFALAIAERNARLEQEAAAREQRAARATLFFSLEMSGQQVMQRLLSQHTGIPYTPISRGRLSVSEMQRVIEAGHEVRGLPLWIDDAAGMTPARVLMKARALKRRPGLKLLLIDHLSFLKADTREETRNLEVGAILKGLRAGAKALGVPLILLSQLSRETERRDDKRPQLADLRDSGEIEQDADAVIFLYREHYYLTRAKPSQRSNESDDKFQRRQEEHERRLADTENLAEAIIAKARNGPATTVGLYFDQRTMRFDDLSTEVPR